MVGAGGLVSIPRERGIALAALLVGLAAAVALVAIVWSAGALVVAAGLGLILIHLSPQPRFERVLHVADRPAALVASLTVAVLVGALSLGWRRDRSSTAA